jgi:hypothetical protein
LSLPVVVLLERVRLDEGVEPNDVGQAPPIASRSSFSRCPTCRVPPFISASFKPLGAEQNSHSGRSDAAPHLVPVVFKPQRQNAAASEHVLPGERSPVACTTSSALATPWWSAGSTA